VIVQEDTMRVGSVEYAMIQPLRWSLDGSSGGTTGLEAFGEIIKAHFHENRAAIIAEVRNWGSDQSLGRNRSQALLADYRSKGTLEIDRLQDLLPQLEELLNRTTVAKYTCDDGDEDMKMPAASGASAKRGTSPGGALVDQKRQKPVSG